MAIKDSKHQRGEKATNVLQGPQLVNSPAIKAWHHSPIHQGQTYMKLHGILSTQPEATKLIQMKSNVSK
jgi:hypothetical protein